MGPFYRIAVATFLLVSVTQPTLAGANLNRSKIKTVILISVDGLGAHLLESVETPEIDRLAQTGHKAPRAETVFPPRTIAGHVSMMTGVEPARHGRIANEHEQGLAQVAVPTLFDLLRHHGLRSTAVVGKEKLKFVFAGGSIDTFHVREWPLIGDFPSRLPSYVQRRVVHEIQNDPATLVFAHFALPDTMGHWFKWGSWIQKQAVQWVDAAIGEIVRSARETLEPGSYTIILTADHGGHEGSHGQGDPQTGQLKNPERDMVIPWIIYGAELVPGTSLVRIYDTAPTVAHLLGLRVPAEWNWQGRSLVR